MLTLLTLGRVNKQLISCDSFEGGKITHCDEGTQGFNGDIDDATHVRQWTCIQNGARNKAQLIHGGSKSNISSMTRHTKLSKKGGGQKPFRMRIQLSKHERSVNEHETLITFIDLDYIVRVKFGFAKLMPPNGFRFNGNYCYSNPKCQQMSEL